MLFEPGPWDNKEACEGIHVFSKKRKLMYGEEHNAAAKAEEGEDYGEKVLHAKHPMWRRKSLAYLQTLAARTTGEIRVERKVPRWNAKEESSHVTGWPNDLGKSYALVEEMVSLGVLSIHQNDDQSTYGIIHRKPLHEAAARFCTETGTDATPAAVAAPAAAAPVPEFEAAARFEGRRPGAAFRLGESGLGYYRDPTQPEAAAVAPAPLPAGWTQGTTPEGYEYYWHEPTGTSAWERPTAATQLVMVVPLSAEAVAALRGAGPSGVAKVQEASGCVVTLTAGQAAVSGTAAGIEHAATLLRRKADGLLYTARAMASARPAAPAPAPSGSLGAQREGTWDFRAVVAVRDAAAAEAPPAGGALAALAGYGDSDDDDE